MKSKCYQFVVVTGDNPDDVKARLKCWAQAVACTVQLCSWMNHCHVWLRNTSVWTISLGHC